MVSVVERINRIQIAAGVLPAVLSVAFLVNQSWLILLLCVLSLFIMVGIVPVFKRRESLYMFILVGIAGLPINVRLSYWLVSEEFISSGFLVGNILWVALLCCVFFSVEEIVFGVVTRLIWKKQYKIKL